MGYKVPKRAEQIDRMFDAGGLKIPQALGANPV